jgi:hypothetical protein
MTSIDLIPPELLVRRETKRRLRTWGKRLLTVAVVGAALFVVLVRMAESGNAELIQMSGRYAALQDRLGQAESLIQERDRLAQHQEAIGAIRRGATVGTYLEALGEAIPENSYLRRIDLRMCNASRPKNWTGIGEEECTATVQLRGTAPTHQDVGRIIRGLFDTGRFEEVGLVSLSEPMSGQGPDMVDFELLCSLKGEPSD